MKNLLIIIALMSAVVFSSCDKNESSNIWDVSYTNETGYNVIISFFPKGTTQGSFADPIIVQVVPFAEAISFGGTTTQPDFLTVGSLDSAVMTFYGPNEVVVGRRHFTGYGWLRGTPAYNESLKMIKDTSLWEEHNILFLGSYGSKTVDTTTGEAVYIKSYLTHYMSEIQTQYRYTIGDADLIKSIKP